MSVDLPTVVVALIAVAFFTACWWLRRRRERRVDTWLPGELRSAKLVYAEQLFRSKGSIRISARVDRAYRDSRGHLVLVELKTRDIDKVYPSDVIELSAQRAALAAATGETVKERAYVLVQSTDGRRRRAHRVELLTEGHVAAIANRRRALLAGTIQARRTCMDGICSHCAFANPCRDPVTPGLLEQEHDVQYQRVHAEGLAAERDPHAHRHEPLTHSHAHFPDAHHRHSH